MLDKVEIRGGKMRDGGVRSMVEKEGRCRNVDVEFVECMLCTVNMYNKKIYIYIYIYGHHPQHLPNSFFEYIYIYICIDRFMNVELPILGTSSPPVNFQDQLAVGMTFFTLSNSING